MDFNSAVKDLLDWQGPTALAEKLGVSPAILYVWRDGGKPRLENYQKVLELHKAEARRQRRIKKT